MTDTQPADVSDLLAEADRTARGLLTEDAEPSEMLEHAEAAAELLESADPEAVLEAVGLETLPDGSEPSSIPEAIARGDDAHVEELRRLLHLANLANGDETDEVDESAETATDELEASVAAVREVGAEHVETGAENGGQDEAAEADTAEEADRNDAAEEEDGGGDGDGDEESTLESVVRSTLDEFDTDLSGVRDRLEAAATTDDDGDGATDGAAAEEPGDGDEPDEQREDATDETDDGTGDDDRDESESDDDGLLGTDLEPDLGSGDGIGSGPSSGRGVARHSTVASSPSDRPDMRGLVRFSTMPKRDSE